MSDRMHLDGLAVAAVIGIHPWERRVRQQLAVDVELDVDASRAAATDRIEDALNYSSLAARIRTLAAEAEAHLLESLAEHLAQAILAEFATRRVRVALTKPGAVREAGVRLEIERHDSS